MTRLAPKLAFWLSPQRANSRRYSQRRFRLHVDVRVFLLGLLLWLGWSVVELNTANAWWSQGHAHITESAVSHLPQPLRRFFEHNIDAISDLADNEPPGNHWIHMDEYPEFFAGEFPRDINVLIERYGSSFVQSRGTGPWTYANYVQTLSSKIADASTPGDWLELRSTAAAMAHYIEDLHNPLHLTENYNGQLTGNTGIHSRYEGEMVLRHLAELSFVEADAVYLPSPIDFAFDGIEQHYWFLDDILAADDLYNPPFDDAYYNGLWNETGAFTQELFQQASEVVANSWYTAWVNAGSPMSFLDHTADFDGDGDVDAIDLARWETSFGDDDLGDADFDGDTDGMDFLAWQRQYTGSLSSSSSGTLPVPEPAAGVFVLQLAWLATQIPIRSYC